MSRAFAPIHSLTLGWEEGIPYSPMSNTPFCDPDKELANTQHTLKENGLFNRWKAIDPDQNMSFVIAETRLGKGLNFLASWFYWLQYAPSTARLHYICCEANPLNKHDMCFILAMWPQFEREARLFIAEYPVLTPGFHQLIFDEGRINLTFMLGEPASCFRQLLHCGDVTLEKTIRNSFVDVWFINHNKVNDKFLQTMAMLSKPGSYVETRNNHKNRNTPWHHGVSQNANARNAIVIGAGLAGCLIAHALASRGWEVILVDSADDIATGASGNTSAVLYPKLSAFDSPLTAFMLSAWLYASRFYSKILKSYPIGDLSGMLQLACNPRETASQAALRDWLDSYPELGQLVNAEQASVLSGIPQEQGGLYVPLSGWLDCKAICQYLVQHPSIRVTGNHQVKSITRKKGYWSVGGGLQSKTVVIANGYQAAAFAQTAHLPVKPVAGLLTSIRSNEKTQALKIPLCGEGHIVPARAGVHVLGASYHPDCDVIKNRGDAEQDNLGKLEKIDNNKIFSHDVSGNWSGIRAGVPDYLPLVGPVPEKDAFEQRFKSLATDSRRWLPFAGDYYPGLYLCAGFGSRGLTTAPLSAEWLASLINGEFSFLPDRQVKSISPARFLIKDIIKTKV